MNFMYASFIRHLLSRQQPGQSALVSLKSGLGGLLAIATVVLLGTAMDNALLMAPFGATCVLLFSLPNSPLSQPANVIGGHLISTLIGLLLNSILPLDWWSLALGVGLAITAMATLRITHPPAGADPLVVFIDNPGWSYLGFPVLSGSLVLIAVAWLFHKTPPQNAYPMSIKSGE